MLFILSDNNKSLRQSKKAAVDFLKLKGIDDAETDTAIILEKITGYTRTQMFMHADDKLNEEQALKLEEMINQRGERRPVQHIVKEAWFYGRSFYVDERVLIPRFDTETLIEETLKNTKQGYKVLDMCTGSGCIIITLAKEAKITGAGADISDGALEVATLNAQRLEADCEFIKSNLFENIADKYDIIVSNPPYIRTQDIEGLEKEVRQFDPMLALDGGDDGLYFYRKITGGAPYYLRENGKLIFEIGFDQAKEVSDIMKENGFTDVKIIRDLANNPRVVSGVKSRKTD
jgi:release factor glutamine methyltransferase